MSVPSCRRKVTHFGPNKISLAICHPKSRLNRSDQSLCCLAETWPVTRLAIQNRQQRELSVKLEHKMARLVLICDGDDLVAHKLGNITTIGRAPLNHIVIDNPAVSAQHAIIARS